MNSIASKFILKIAINLLPNKKYNLKTFLLKKNTSKFIWCDFLTTVPS